MEPTDKMQSSYELQLEVADVDIIQRRQEEENFRRFSLKPHVISFASNILARLVSGVARSGDDKASSGVQTYLRNRDNFAKVNGFLQEAKLSGEPADLAVALDRNYDLRNGGAHNTTDEYLEHTAAELKGMGALRLLGKELPWQCALIEHFALVKAHLLT